MRYAEHAITFPIGADTGLGIIANPAQAKALGVMVAVGGPQYRAGSHRQFVLLSRALAEAGYPTMRFDYRGMGDSTGEARGFEVVIEDFGAAIDAFLKHYPHVDRVVLWGLCDAASASLLYCDATTDARVAGLVLLNPWVRSEASLAKTHIRHYYGQRLIQADFWGKLLTGKLGIGRALAGFFGSVKQARNQEASGDSRQGLLFQHRMARALGRFNKPVALLLSGNDYTAKEFLQVVQTDPVWEKCLKLQNVSQVDIPEADHTFSSAKWRRQVEQATMHWLANKLQE